MSAIRCYRDLRVWQRGVDLVCLAYRISRELPGEERFALGDQIRRSATAIPANIAEGHTRRHRRECLQAVNIARGELSELETHLIVAQRVGHLDAATTAPALVLCEELGRMLARLRNRLEQSDQRGRGPAGR